MKENTVLKPQGVEPNEADPQLCSKPEAAIPVVQENNEVAEPPQVNTGNPTVTPKLESALPVNLEMKKEAEPIESQAEHPKPQPCSEPDPTPSEDRITPIQQSKKKKRNRRERRKIKCSEEKVENQSNPLQCSLIQIQPDSAIPVCPKPASPIDHAIPADPATKVDPALSVCPKPVEAIIGQTIPVSPAIPIDTEQKTVEKERKGTLDGAESNKHNTKPPETLVQTAICPNAAAPIGPATPTDPGQKPTKRKRKYKRKNALKSTGEEPNKHDGTPHEIPVQRSMFPTAATPIDPTIPMDQIIPLDPAIKVDHSLSVCPKPVETIIGQTIPVSPAIPIDTEQKTVEKERKGTLDGAESNEHNTEPPKTLVQTAICPIAAAPIGPAIPTDPGQKLTKRKRKYKRKNALKSAGEEPNKHDGTPHEIPVQRSMFPIAATPIDPTIPMDQIIPIDPATTIYPEQKMPQKKRKKKRKSALKSQGGEPNKHDGKPHEIPVQRCMCPIAATLVDPTIPMDQIIPIDSATTTYPEQKMPQKKRKKKRKSALKSEGEEPSKHDGKPHETPVQRSMCPIAATPVDPTIPMDQIIQPSNTNIPRTEDATEKEEEEETEKCTQKRGDRAQRTQC